MIDRLSVFPFALFHLTFTSTMSVFIVPLVLTSFVAFSHCISITVEHNDRKKSLLESMKTVAETDANVIFKFCVFVDLEELSPEEQNILNSVFCPSLSLRTGGVFETMNNPVVYPTFLFYMLNSFEDVYEKLDFVSSLNFFSTRIPAFFVLNFEVEDKEVAENFMKELWKKYSLLFSGLIFFKTEVQLISYQPFKRVVVNLSNKDELSDYFLNHEYANLNGKVFNLAVFNNPPRNVKRGRKWTGEDPNFWINLIDSLNASWRLVQTKDFSYEDAMRAVANGDADFCPYRFFNVDNYTNIEFLTPFVIDYLVGVVSKSKRIPRFFNILKTSKPILWISTFVSAVSLMILMMVSGKLHSDRNRPIALCIFGICLNQSVKRIASYHSLQIFLLNLWQFGCLVISATFQGALLETLLVPEYPGQIDKIEDLVKSNLTIYVVADMRKLVEISVPNLTQQLVAASEKEICDLLTNFGQDYAVILPYRTAYMIVRNYRILRDGHIMKQSLVPGFSTYFFRKNSPYINIFHEMIARHLQYGLASVSLTNRGTQRNGGEPSENLSFSHLHGVFQLIYSGLIVSVFLFLLEKCFHFFHNVDDS
ncbi:uncharacterized protein LOC123307156 [Coccinella septempunctata]|uniref:uncharacterized protein LOC123307156 n=1 Tax=Coccinella septempunctata TaxID=41139 RepID=UPI001D0724F2|nr:uncharacterized protein LOC123307156 [Coccinella septempunctata]